MDLLNYLKKSVGLFALACIAVIALAVVIFYYVDVQSVEPQVLGEHIDGGANSLFGLNVRLVKTANNPSVYAIVANQKHLIRNEEVFYSYDFSFDNIEIVSRSDLNRYPVAKLVKEEKTGRIYYLSHGKNLKKYHPSPEAFNAYPGNKWGNVIEVSQKDMSFFQEATLLKAVNDNKVYYVDGGRKAWVKTENEFINSGFHWEKILTVFKQDLDTYSNIDFSVDLVKGNKPAPNQNNQNNQPQVTGGQLIVTVDRTSPEASVFPVTTSDNIVNIFKLQAVNQNIVLSKVVLTKKGVLNNSALSLITITDENGVVYGETTNINAERRAEINFRDRKLLVPKGTEKKLVVKINISSAAQHNGTFSLGLDKEADLYTSGQVSGIFPMSSPSHRIIAIEDFIGVLKIESEEVNSNLRQVNIGVKKEIVAKFKLSEVSGNEDVSVEKITFYNEGTASGDSFDYVYLYKDSKKIATTKDMVNNRITFDLDEDGLIIEKNDSVDISIRVDIAQGENLTSKFVVRDPGDVKAKGLEQYFNLSLKSDSRFPVGRGSGDDYNKILIKRDGIGFFAKRVDEDDREVYRGTENAVLGEFELRNISEDIYLQRLRIQIEKFNSAPDIDSDLVLVDTSNRRNPEIITRIDKNRLASGTIADVRLSNIKIEAGDEIDITATAGIPKNAESNNSYRVIVHKLSYKIGNNNTEYAHESVVLGPIMRVFAPQLAITKGELKNEGTGEAGEEKVELASFNAKASIDERIRITSVTVSLITNSDDITYAGGFSNLALYAGSRRKSDAIDAPNSRTYTFNDLNIRVSANRDIDLFIKADTETSTDGKTITFKIDDIVAQGYSSKAPVLINGEGTVSDSVALALSDDEE